MRIKSINCYPLLINNKYPYYWSHGIINSTEIILIEIEAENGVKGYGESIATPVSYTHLTLPTTPYV